ncbi:MAG: class I SAM-dependent methyltransferase [Desulfobacterales bacterium]|nr:MAG: class I SAM-dependent methyltransferase [Desulfobacterales bacterium]
MKMIDRDETDVFRGFLKRIQNEVFSEADSELHISLIDRMVPKFVQFLPNRQVAILDVGCGQGYACVKFRGLGFENLTAITLSPEDVHATRERGIACYQMDMTFLKFDDKAFGALWVRHALEHSPFPYLTLLEFNRVLKKDGFVYLEMPLPDTPRQLEFWPNHYSLFNEKMWVSLFGRSGFKALASTRLEFSLQMTSINEGLPFLQSNLVFVLQKEREEILMTPSIGS